MSLGSEAQVGGWEHSLGFRLFRAVLVAKQFPDLFGRLAQARGVKSETGWWCPYLPLNGVDYGKNMPPAFGRQRETEVNGSRGVEQKSLPFFIGLGSAISAEQERFGLGQGVSNWFKLWTAPIEPEHVSFDWGNTATLPIYCGIMYFFNLPPPSF